jgi:pyruvate-formate lyase
MPRGVPLTPDQIAEATRVYLATGNYSEAARAIGSDNHSHVRRALIAAREPERAQLHTHALAKAERDARRALQRVRAKLEAFVEEAVDTKDLTALAAQVHDNARATTQMRVAHAKLTGDHAPDKHAHTVEADDALASKLARLAAAAATGEDPR